MSFRCWLGAHNWVIVSKSESRKIWASSTYKAKCSRCGACKIDYLWWGAVFREEE